MPLFLTSMTFAGIGGWLDSLDAAEEVVLVTNASRKLADGEMMLALAEAELSDEHVRATRVDVLEDGVSALASASAAVIAGGNPFQLLADLRTSSADTALAAACARGVPLAGQSAGAMVLGPSLEPIRFTSPFTAPDDLNLDGLGLTHHVVLPHQNRSNRAARHRDAALSFPDKWTLTALWDDESLFPDAGPWFITRAGARTRTATPGDAQAVARLFHDAAQQAWAPFLGAERLARADLDIGGWTRRIAMGGKGFLVTEDDQGLLGFVSSRPSAGAEEDTRVAELDLLYTHPRAWGSGVGRRLLARATWNMLCEGFREAVLWTEVRNHRALDLYRRAGWRADGALDEREYLGVPIRNVRRRLDLTRYAGGE